MKFPGLTFAGLRIAAGCWLALAAASAAPAVDFPQGLVLHLNFDQVEAGGVIADRTGRNNNGRAVGARWTSTGRQGGACEFMATNSYVRVTNSPSLNPTQATFAAWFKTAKPDSTRRYILDKLGDCGYALSIAGEADAEGEGEEGGEEGESMGKLCVGIGGQSCLGDSVVTDGGWHHGAATFDGENLKLYVDGQLQKQVVFLRGAIPANTNDLTIGLNRSNPRPQEQGTSFNGLIDEVMIFNHALSEAEVKAVIAAVRPKFTKDQVARRLIQLKELLDRGLILKEFYDRKVEECEVVP
jgi:hypothetical protein